MSDLVILALEVVALLLALFIVGFCIRKRRPLLGYFVGLVPLYIPWQLFMLQIPSAEYCRQNSLACEWTGISVFIITGFTVLMAIVYSALSVSMAAYHRRVGLKGALVHVSKRRTFALTTIAILTTTSLLGGGLGFSLVSLINSGVFVAWQNLGNPPEPSLTNRLAGEKTQKIRSYDLRQIQVETNQGRSFETDIEGCLKDRLPQQQNCWYYAQVTDLPPVGVMACPPSFWVRNPPEKVVQQVQARACNAVETIQTDYALLENGDVWTWHHQAQTDPAIRTVAIILGTVLGLVVGSVIVFRLSRVNRT